MYPSRYAAQFVLILSWNEIIRQDTDIIIDKHRGRDSTGAGAYEIRYRDNKGAFRVIYVAKFSDALYVLHAFQKKAQKTPKSDIDLAANRYKRLVEALK